MRSLMRLMMASLAVVSLAGAVQAQPYQPIPPLREEAIPPPPGPRFVWRPGYYQWEHGGYVWVSGMYVPRRAGYRHWVPAFGRVDAGIRPTGTNPLAPR